MRKNVLVKYAFCHYFIRQWRHTDGSLLQKPNSLLLSASFPPFLDQRAGVNINPDRLVWKSLSHFIWKEVWQITEEGRIPQWQEVAALFTQTLWDPCSDMLLLHPVRRLFPKQTQPRLSLLKAGPHKLPEKDLECWGATRKQDVGKPNRPYKALDMVSLVNLTGVWCSLRGVKGKANFSSILSQQVQTQTSAVFHAEKCASDAKKVWGEQPAKCVFWLRYNFLFKICSFSLILLWKKVYKSAMLIVCMISKNVE